MKSATNSPPPATPSLQHSKELKERPPLSKKIADCPLLKSFTSLNWSEAHAGIHETAHSSTMSEWMD
ncbi:hypothetical protein B9Z55_020868 [Caenorhabditis nigoni]|uniref:Uncharacterized protein n=1 Tax=Caenorhabditis nigoni TaxID=1611254 RepID=A0A2G5TPG8_9PELO|nr:hypothetical protein B9Z55_020868 [Caenorhabditis nigoni]